MTTAKYHASWCEAELADICSKPQYGYTTKASTTGSVKFLRTTDITKGSINWEDVPFCEAAPEDRQKYQLEDRDIVISRAGSIGFSSLLIDPPDKSVFASYLIRFKPSQQFTERFLKRFLESHSYWNQLASMSAGNAVQNVNAQKLAKILVPVAPIAEQKVIADKLDILLAQVENTQARLKRIPQILKRFRQSVLATAVSGRLTEEWRSNSESYIHKNTENWNWAPVPTTWTVRLYPELVESRLGKMLDKAKNSGLPTKYLGNINVRWFDFNLSEVQEILVSEGERNELSIRPGDVLICEGGEPGRCAVWDGRIEGPIVFQKALHRARVSEALLPEWLALNLKHDADNLTLEQLFTGTTIKHLTGKGLKKYPLRIPPIEEQTEIVHQIGQLFAHADRIEQQVNNALARVNNLTQSILAKAFRGELTEQWRKDNPELISGENSAEALLERIKVEQAAKKPTKRRRKPDNGTKAS